MNGQKRHLKTQSLDVVAFVGSVAISAAAAVGAAKGKGFTVTKIAGTGLYRVTLAAKYRCPGATGYVAVQCALATAAGTVDRQVKPVTGGDQTTGIFDFQVVKTSDGAAVDPTQAVELHFVLFLRDTTQPQAA